ncbi:MAG TPA: molybdopterin cofactor-binding domain-containing protein [Candidatus Acidoferrum sp.]|nr:molybdopterin cofactor-binding domain-containing protein [Candidatus Acidoferrum sp.]
MVQIENVSRRGFLKGVLGTSAFVLGARFLPGTLLNASGIGTIDAMSAAALQPNVYLAIAADGTIYIVAARSEMGSGNRTGLPMIVADELDADWKRVSVIQGTGNEKYGDQDTDGSHSVKSFFDTLRESGASARLMLVRAAAKTWNVPESECITESSTVVHQPSGKKLSYGELASSAAKLPVPRKEELKLKDRTDWKFIGKPTPSYDLRNMTIGKAVYGQDVRMDGMLFASVAHPPVYGGAVKSVDDAATLRIGGVKQTITIDPWKPPVGMQALGGVAVVADNTWAAFQGKKKLKVEWTKSEHGVWNSDAFRKDLEATAKKPCKVVRELGDVDLAFTKGGKVVEAEYYAPMLAHASMEPPAALANFQDGKVVIWAPTQNPQGAQEAVAAAVGVKKEDVTVNVTLLGGAFGRKSFPDFIVEASVLSKKTGKPVKVVWSREDDIKFDSFHSVAAMYFKATLGANGMPTGWLQRSVFPPIASTFEATAQYADAGEIGLGFSDVPFAIPNQRAENGPAPAHTRIGWLRSVANIYHAYGIHSFTGECAHAAGKDQVDYLLALLGPDRIIPKSELPKDYTNYDSDLRQYPLDTARFKRVVQLAAEKSGWGKKKLGAGFGMGIAVHRSFLTYVATVVQAEVKDGQVIVHRVDTALDAGTIVNPTTVRQQFEGAAVMGISIAFYGEITATHGVIDQSNYDTFRVARIPVAPKETNIHIVQTDAPPAGVGEPGLPPFAPALYNAIFLATGKRYREMPLSKVGLA